MPDASTEDFLSSIPEIRRHTRCAHIASLPVCIVNLAGQSDQILHLPLLLYSRKLARAAKKPGLFGLFRTVSIDRLPTILTTGCDVVPSDSVLWADRSPEKSLEYGDGYPKVVQVFNNTFLEPSWRQVPLSLPEDELHQILRIYKTKRVAEDGSYLWLSRLPGTDGRIDTPHEHEHAFWIPGEPLDALLAVVVIGQSAEELNRAVEVLTGGQQGGDTRP